MAAGIGRPAPRNRSAADSQRLRIVRGELLRHHVERGLAESLGDGLYHITPLGRQVVDALPDRTEVARLRGLRPRSVRTE